MDSTTTGIMLIALVLGGLALLFLAGGSSEPVGTEPIPPRQPAQIAAPAVTPARPTAPPLVEAGADVTLDEGGSVRLQGQGYDPSGGELTYTWTAPAGRFDDPHSLQPVYTAPSVCGCEECIPLTLTATNSAGMSASDQLYVRIHGDPISCSGGTSVKSCGNPCPPQAPARPVYRCEPEPPPCASGCVRHVMPVPACPKAPVPCCDSPCGWPLGFLVSPRQPTTPADHPKPLIDRHYPAEISEGGAVQLSARVNNPACTEVCFTWTASKGWFERADTLSPIYHAPNSDRIGGEDAAITLTLHDGLGGTSRDQIRIHIRNLDPQRHS